MAAVDSPKSFLHFLDLPPELRIRVYECVIIRSDSIDLRKVKLPRKPRSDLFGRGKRRDAVVKHNRHHWQELVRQPALTQISRLVRQEPLPLFYTRNIWIGHATRIYDDRDHSPFFAMRRWLHCIGRSNRKLLKLHFDSRALKEVLWDVVEKLLGDDEVVLRVARTKGPLAGVMEGHRCFVMTFEEY